MLLGVRHRSGGGVCACAATRSEGARLPRWLLAAAASVARSAGVADERGARTCTPAPAVAQARAARWPEHARRQDGAHRAGERAVACSDGARALDAWWRGGRRTPWARAYSPAQARRLSIGPDLDS